MNLDNYYIFAFAMYPYPAQLVLSVVLKLGSFPDPVVCSSYS